MLSDSVVDEGPSHTTTLKIVVLDMGKWHKGHGSESARHGVSQHSTMLRSEDYQIQPYIRVHLIRFSGNSWKTREGTISPKNL